MRILFMITLALFFSVSTFAATKSEILTKDTKEECGVVKGIRSTSNYHPIIVFEDREFTVFSTGPDWDPYLAASMSGAFPVCIKTYVQQGYDTILEVIRK